MHVLVGVCDSLGGFVVRASLQRDLQHSAGKPHEKRPIAVQNLQAQNGLLHVFWENLHLLQVTPTQTLISCGQGLDDGAVLWLVNERKLLEPQWTSLEDKSVNVKLLPDLCRCTWHGRACLSPEQCPQPVWRNGCCLAWPEDPWRWAEPRRSWGRAAGRLEDCVLLDYCPDRNHSLSRTVTEKEDVRARERHIRERMDINRTDYCIYAKRLE